jgi:cytochrome oxidase Cu insertion factor (SCO1/SenC/PrrC family)
LYCTIFLATAPVFAQLGPKDGAGQAPTDLERVKVGQPAPDFTLTNMDGKPISLADFRGKKNLVLVFYRGHW